MVSVTAEMIFLFLQTLILVIFALLFFVSRRDISRKLTEFKKILDNHQETRKSENLASHHEKELPNELKIFSSAIKNQPEKVIDLVRFYLNQEDSKDRLKVAVLLVALGSELSTEIFKYLREDEIETLIFEISRLETIDNTMKTAVLKELHASFMANRSVLNGGMDYARELLKRSLGENKTIDIINRLTSSLHVKPFDFIRRTDPAHLLNFIQQEHPQIIALILAYIDPDKAAILLQNLPTELQGEITRRIATIDRTSPEVLREIERVLEKKLATLSAEDYHTAGGIESAVEILNHVNRACEKQIFGTLEDEDPELADEIKRRLFVFEDIVMLDDRAIQKVIRDIDSRWLAIALKNANEEIRDKLIKNMTKRDAKKFKKIFVDPVRLIDVEDAQKKIVSIIHDLENTGEIVMARVGEDEIVA